MNVFFFSSYLLDNGCRASHCFWTKVIREQSVTQRSMATFRISSRFSKNVKFRCSMYSIQCHASVSVSLEVPGFSLFLDLSKGRVLHKGAMVANPLGIPSSGSRTIKGQISMYSVMTNGTQRVNNLIFTSIIRSKKWHFRRIQTAWIPYKWLQYGRPTGHNAGTQDQFEVWCCCTATYRSCKCYTFEDMYFIVYIVESNVF